MVVGVTEFCRTTCQLVGNRFLQPNAVLMQCIHLDNRLKEWGTTKGVSLFFEVVETRGAIVDGGGYKINLDENWWVLVPSVPSVTDVYGHNTASVANTYFS